MTNLDKLAAWDVDFYNSIIPLPRNLCLDEQQIYILGQALRQVTWSTRWHGDTSAMNLNGIAGEIESILAGGNCGDTGQCYELSPQSAAFEFWPNNPYTDPSGDESPYVITQVRWNTISTAGLQSIPYVGNALEAFVTGFSGYFNGDVLLVPDTFNILDNPIERFSDLFDINLLKPVPYIKLTVDGECTVHLTFISFPFGGSCLIIPDLNISWQSVVETVQEFLDGDTELPNFWTIVELDRDLLQVPPELSTTVGQTIKFDTNEEHTIHMVFLPTIDFVPPFIRPFGGLRSVEICGANTRNTQTGEPIGIIDYGDPENIQTGVIQVSNISDICDGVICALEKSASRFLSGQAGNTIGTIQIDNDGSIQVISSGGVGSSGGTVQEQKSGGTYKAANELNAMFGDIQNWICGIAVGTATTKLYFKALYLVDDDIAADTFIDNVVSYLGACGGAIWYEQLIDEMSESMFCNGVNKQALSLAIIENGIDANKVALMLEAIAVISQSQIDEWYTQGLEIPLSEYLAYACYIRQDLFLTYTATNYTNRTSVTVVPVNWSFDHARAVRITCSGLITSIGTAGEQQDLFYYKADSNTDPVPVNHTTYFRTSSSAPTHNLYPTNIPLFSPTGDYSFTIVVPANQWGNFIQMYWIDNEAIDDPQGQLDFTFEDLGEVT